MHTIVDTEMSRNQELLWQETVDNSQETEEALHRGEETPLNIMPQLLCDVQVLVSRLAAKSRQLIGNHTTNLAEAWMHIRCKLMAERSSVDHKVDHGSIDVGGWIGANLWLNVGSTDMECNDRRHSQFRLYRGSTIHCYKSREPAKMKSNR